MSFFFDIIIPVEDMRENLTIILISGKARHGKTTFAKMLKEAHALIGRKAVATSYAKYLKLYARELTDWNGENETKPRDFLHNLGTTIRKDLDKPEFLVERLNDDIDVYKLFVETVIIDDARLPLEIEYFKTKYHESVKTLRIVRPNFESDLNENERSHETELKLDNYDSYDYTIINDGSLEDLRAKAHELIERI